MWKYRSSNHIAHYGIKGQKWGIRRYQNRDGSLTTAGVRRYGVENSRTLKSGTKIQNISRDDLSATSNSYKSKRLYSSYTDYDKTGYVDLMGNWQYGGKGMKNTFLVKQDIKIASERDVVKTLAEMYRDNPDRVTQLMSDAYRAQNLTFFGGSKRSINRHMKRLVKNVDSSRSLEIGRQFLHDVPITGKASDLANDFYARMVKKGFDAVLDPNDAYQGAGAQDPLIIFNMDKLGKEGSVPLTYDELRSAYEYTYTHEYQRSKKDSTKLAHSIGFETSISDFISHYGVKGMKWGVRKDSYDSNSKLRTGYTIPKGTEIQNISYGKTRDIRSGYSPIYAAVSQKDKLSYKGLYSAFLNMDGDTDVYANVFTVNKNLKVASQKEAVDIFMEMVREDPKGYGKAFAKAGAGQTLASQLFYPLKVIKRHQTYKQYVKAGEEFLQQEGYANFVQLMGTDNKKTNKIREEYYKRLSDAGYDAIFDVYDINKEVSSEPIILINPSESIGNSKAILLSEKDINDAIDEYEKLLNAE